MKLACEVTPKLIGSIPMSLKSRMFKIINRVCKNLIIS